ncbi:MAG TPA: acetoacetate--CoA ligase [Stellaceae bacterium]|nr:acetoacetate--CoA ligase [Stellaceae bacterium]
MDNPLWRPGAGAVEHANLSRFARAAALRWQHRFGDYEMLHRWSCDRPQEFWLSLWEFAGIVGEPGDTVLVDGDKMPGAKFFPRARLNFAENLLRRRDNGDAIVFRGEERVRRRLSHRQLYDSVSRFAQALTAQGIKPGDRVAGYMPNLPETVIACLAAAAIGAVWSSCSPDFGVKGVLDRFGQIEPKLLILADGYFYNGKRFDNLEKAREIAAALPSVARVVVVPYSQDAVALDGIAQGVSYDDFLAPFAAGEIAFARLPFAHPLYILYSSGTTGVPKCIVHCAGGAILQHTKEHLLHCDIKPDDRVFYFTTCGWMMWNWLISALASGATLMLYDGSPFHPGPGALFDFAEEEHITFFGTSAKFLDALHKSGFEPIHSHALATMRALGSTGSPLAPESFDFVYDKVKRDVFLFSMSGGTDLLACFAIGNPLWPVWRGELQCAALGMAVDVFGDDGKPAKVEEKGELVCTRSFPSMPLGFWNDPDGEKYFAAYYAHFPQVWTHGDFAARTRHGGFIIFGRSDAVLNPGGVRIGTAEIYRQVEQIADVLEALAIGQEWHGDSRVVLFVKLRDGVTLDESLEQRIRRQIRDNASPRHVPAKIVAVADIPRTKSGKIVEIAVRDIVHGRPVKNQEALANPEALALYKDLPVLAS